MDVLGSSDNRYSSLRPPLILLITTECNGGCLYCYADPLGKGKVMDIKTAEKAIDIHFAEKNANKEILVSGGGEPTIQIGLIKKIKKKLISVSPDHSLYLLTNGFFPIDTLSWINENIDGITVSYDGTSDANRFSRPSIFGGDMTSAVEENIAIMSKKIPVAIRMTVGEFNISLLEKAIIKAKELGVRGISFSPFVESERSKRSGMREMSLMDFVKKALQAKDFGDFTGMKVKTEFLPIEKRKSFCGFELPMRCVAPEGLLTACFESFGDEREQMDFSYGRVSEKGEEIDKSRYAKIIKRSTKTIPECLECPIADRCAGGCAARHFRKTGDIMKPDKEFCEAVRFGVSEWEKNKDVPRTVRETKDGILFTSPFGEYLIVRD